MPLEVDRARSALASAVEDGPVGVACCNDDVALAVLAAARALNRRTPEDVAVVGVDHTPVGQLWSPPLTTIDVDVRAIMDTAIQDLQIATNRATSDDGGHGALARLVRGGTT